MKGKFLVVVGAGLMSAATIQPAAAYDPCQRAYVDERDAEARFGQWCDNHLSGPSHSSCSVEGRGEVLYNDWQNAVRRRENACR